MHLRSGRVRGITFPPPLQKATAPNHLLHSHLHAPNHLLYLQPTSPFFVRSLPTSPLKNSRVVRSCRGRTRGGRPIINKCRGGHGIWQAHL